MFFHFWVSLKHSILKNILNIIVWTFVGFGFYLLFIADERFQPYPKFQAGMAFLSVLAMFIPYIVFYSLHLYERYERGLLIHLEALVVIPLTLNGIGARWLYDLNIEFDSFVHFINTFLLVLLTGVVLWLLQPMMLKKRQLLTFISLAVVFILVGVFFEAYEKFSDIWFHTSMWGEGGLQIVIDTRDDIFYDSLGAIAAAAYFAYDGIHLLERWVKKPFK